MIELRWYSTAAHVTAAKVARYADVHGVSMNEAKAKLENRTKPRLQYKLDGIGAWTDIPHVHEVLE